jgi:hypothetical protein
MKKQKIKKSKNSTFASLDKNDFVKIVRASNSLIDIINSQEKRKKEREKTENEIQEFMSNSNMEIQKRFEDVIEKIDRVAANQDDRKVTEEMKTIKKLLTNIMIDTLDIPI